MRKKKLCYSCKDPYNKDHDCPLWAKGKANRFMWEHYEDSDSDEDDHQFVLELNQGDETSTPMTYIANVQTETTFRFRGTVDVQHCIAMLDTSAPYKFTNGNFVALF